MSLTAGGNSRRDATARARRKFTARPSQLLSASAQVQVRAFSDRTFEFDVKTPRTSYFLKKAAGIEKGTATPGHAYIGKISVTSIYEVALVRAREGSGQPAAGSPADPLRRTRATRCVIRSPRARVAPAEHPPSTSLHRADQIYGQAHPGLDDAPNALPLHRRAVPLAWPRGVRPARGEEHVGSGELRYIRVNLGSGKGGGCGDPVSCWGLSAIVGRGGERDT